MKYLFIGGAYDGKWMSVLSDDIYVSLPVGANSKVDGPIDAPVGYDKYWYFRIGTNFVLKGGVPSDPKYVSFVYAYSKLSPDQVLEMLMKNYRPSKEDVSLTETSLSPAAAAAYHAGVATGAACPKITPKQLPTIDG